MMSAGKRLPTLLAIAALAIGAGILTSGCGGAGGSGQPSATPIPPPSPAAASPVVGASPSPSPSPIAGAAPGQAGPPGGLTPAASPEAAAGGESSYTVAEGDTLGKIAEQFYGDPNLWRRIYDANRQAIGDNPDNLQIGATLRIPPRQ